MQSSPWKHVINSIRQAISYAVAATAMIWATPGWSADGAATADGPLPAWQSVVSGILKINLFDIPVWRLGLSLLVLLLGFSLRGFLLDRLLMPVKVIFERTETDIDNRFLEAIRHPLGWVVNLVAAYVSLVLLEPPEAVMTVASLILQTVGTVLVAWVVYKLIDVAAYAMTQFAGQTTSQMDDNLVPLVRRVIRVVLFVVVGITIVQQWGYDVTSLIAGLGIGGLAFALAAKPTLSNWFGSVMIFTDRPFKLGDWVSTDFGEGIIEEVGLRSTRIRTFKDTLITVPNADIATTAVENCSAMTRRKLNTHIRLVYGTTSAQLEAIMAAIEQRLADDERIEDDTSVVYFDSLGQDALEVLIKGWALTTAYDEFMQIQQAVYLDILTIVEDADTQLARPSRSLYVQQDADPVGR